MPSINDTPTHFKETTSQSTGSVQVEAAFDTSLNKDLRAAISARDGIGDGEDGDVRRASEVVCERNLLLDEMDVS